ncbi:MAG: galactose oxidase [Verrucomicrobiaceae bacterium]|nr:galactose oxidase [Verrucomicrobiaceae bacterium]
MIRKYPLLALCAIQLSIVAGELQWRTLPGLPDSIGFAGSFAGDLNGKLLVAGGANFPERKPWEGGTKVWYDTIHLFDGEQWIKRGKLPQKLGYGTCYTTGNGIVIAGGSHANGHSDEVYLLNADLSVVSLPKLPKPCANSCGTMIGRALFIAGGIEEPNSTEALHSFWKLDLERLDTGWQSLPPWPGKGRMLATAARLNNEFYLIGGAALKSGPDGKPERVWLNDAFAFSSDSGWRELPKLHSPSVAAPSPAPVLHGHVYLLGGDDGTQLKASPNDHKGFPTTIWKLSPDGWTEAGAIPTALVTTSSTLWRGQWVIPGGEVRPGVRSTEVLALEER